MTLTKQTLDTLVENGLEYIRDQLRTNATVGLGKSEGTKALEVGDITLATVAKNPDSRYITLTPTRVTKQRQGGVIEYTVHFTVNTYMSTPLSPTSKLIDGQKRHRQYTGRAYNETLHLHGTGRTAGHWSDLTPDGGTEYANVPLEDRTILTASTRLAFVQDLTWITGA